MTSSRSLVNLTATARAVVVALISSLLVIAGPLATESKADYTSFTSYTNDADIRYNDQVCNLGDPADHLSSETAFEISTAEQLWEVTDCVSNSATVFFKLANDIDVSSAASAPTQSPIGFVSSALQYAFLGVLDGSDKSIHSVEMTTSSYGVGLFAHLSDATISNLAIDGSFTTTTTQTVSNVHLHAAGALAIRSTGHIALISISNRATVTGNTRVGGLVGYVENSVNVSSSRNLATISASSEYAGGLIGLANSTPNIIMNSQNTGAVSTGNNAGGLIGQTQNNTKIEASYNTGDISATSNRGGGLVGRGSGTTEIITSYNTGTVSGGNDLDGLVGLGGTVTTTSAYSSVDSAYVATTPVADMKLASTFAGFDFDNTWGFGSPADNQGFPMLRVFAELTTYYSDFAKFSSNSDLVALALSQGTLDPVFTSGTTTYTASVPNANSSITVTPTRADSGASITVEGIAVSSGNASGAISLAVGSNALSIVVTAADSTTTTYTITVTRAAAEQNQGQTPAQPPAYAGPVIAGAQSAAAGTEVTFTGNRLESVTRAEVGGVQVTIVSALAEAVTLEMPSSMPPGTYDLKLQSGFGTLTFQQGLTVLASSTEETETETSAESEQVDQKLTVGAFQGFIAIYTKGYEGQKLSAKVAGKWLVVSELDETWNGNDYSRTLRAAGSGYDISVHLYIDGKFIRTHEITTK